MAVASVCGAYGNYDRHLVYASCEMEVVSRIPGIAKLMYVKSKLVMCTVRL
jgi:hypothetical protein